VTKPKPIPAPTYKGTFAGGLSSPSGIAVNGGGDVWVTDSGANRVIEYSASGKKLREFGRTGSGTGELNDPNALTLPTGNSVFHQPYPSHVDGYLLPFHYDTKTTSAAATPGLAHDWTTQHEAWDDGKMDQWISAKGPNTMGYFEREDIPFHTALAEAFTICDNYHCSVLGPTNPNRLYMWTGMIDPEGTGGGPITDNTPAFNNPILSWTTYPERLTKAGVSWQVYQEEDNYDDNALEWCKQFADAPRNSELYQRGMTRKSAGWFEYDALHDRLPQVSWLVAPSAQSEHPDWTPAGGAAESVDGVPIGPGFRVPTIVVSPWTAGGYVDSTLTDHTSLIRILERRFGVTETNTSAYRRQVMGDFTTSLQFNRTPAAYPTGNRQLQKVTVAEEFLAMQQQVADNPAPTVPTGPQTMPTQG